MFVDSLKGEAAARQLDESNGTGGTRWVALEPLVDGLIGEAQIRIVGERLHDARDAEVSHPSTELGLPLRGDSPVASPGQSVLPEHLSPLGGSRGIALGPGWVEGAYRLRRRKGGWRP